MAEKKRKLFADDDVRNVYTPCGNPDNARVDPSYAQDSQIENMLAKFARGEVHPRQAFYGDVSDFGGFREMQERVMSIRADFDKLPAAVRALCLNDPANFQDVVANPANTEFLKQQGVFKQLPQKEPGGSEGTPGAGSGGQPQENEPEGELQEAKPKGGASKTRSVE